MIKKKIGIIGCGNMGEAILSRLAKKGISAIVGEIDRSRKTYVEKKYKATLGPNNKYVVEHSDVIVLAVKPKDFDGALKELRNSFSKDKLLISIAAGITTKYIEGIIGEDIPVIRAMPNILATIGEAVTSISAGKSAGDKHIRIAKDIFSAVGEVVEVDEDLVDSVTAISGSGPAYFFYLVEALIEAAKKLGLEEEVAKKLVLKTALGSSRLLETLKDDPAVLRQKVASKGGTTEAALKVFESENLKKIINDAARAARKRSRELSRG